MNVASRRSLSVHPGVIRTLTCARRLTSDPKTLTGLIWAVEELLPTLLWSSEGAVASAIATLQRPPVLSADDLGTIEAVRQDAVATLAWLMTDPAGHDEFLGPVCAACHLVFAYTDQLLP